ncbi:ClpP-like prohead protease/major capsid protein fusion protein [Xanthomonas campestris]|uniref:ClpP-like prohead protease/major capsid protein fusion protein n=1 Tax=Xanthomonas campestris TaxID=339 RepID=UPI002B2346BB|nr:ClpP-like prohead protease/major capsid protein fusion protein [Xanthomonas campestris]MEA9657835.1 ClpP-like prohead protease/major capsid protein fusion protein [Xanthomonas campestris pv. raphani]
MRPHALTAALGRVLADAGPALGPCLLKIEARATDVAEVMIYGTIGDSLWSESVSPLQLAEQIGQISAGTIHVRINSGGGVVADGMAIYNALKQHAAHKVVFVDGQAASIASLIAMAGDELVMYASSLLMVHAPHTIAAGNASSFRQYATALDAHAGAMLEAYATKTGKRAEVEQLLTDGADHWYTGAQAVEFGFADRVADTAATARAEAASVVALTGYLQAITQAPAPVAAQLRGHIAAALSPSVFASLPEVTQTAVVGHIEDPMTQQTYLRILANAGGGQGASPTTATPPAPAPAPVVAAAPDAAAAVQAALVAMRGRNADIMAMAEPHMGNAEIRAYVDGVIAAADPAVTPDNVGRHILALMGSNSEPLNGRAGVVAGGDQRDNVRAAMTNAIQARVGLAQATGDNPYRGHSLAEMARECLVQAGVNPRGMDRREIVGMAFTHSTSDFPALLGDAARRSVLQGYQEVEERFSEFTRAVSVPDFKPTNLVGLGAFSDLLPVREGGEYKQGTFSEQSQSMQIITWGRLFTITRQAIINDDLGIFSDVPRKMGQAAKRTLAKAVYDLITKNPKLADGKTLFHADHGNLLPAAGITTESVSAMQARMALQKDADGNIIRVPMKTLLTPVALSGAALTVRAAEYAVGGANNQTTPNIVRNTFEVESDGRLDGADPKAWYGLANSAYVDALVVGYLDGNQTPYLEQHEGFTVDGVAWKVRLDAAPAIADYRGIYKNPGQQ